MICIHTILGRQESKPLAKCTLGDMEFTILVEGFLVYMTMNSVLLSDVQR